MIGAFRQFALPAAALAFVVAGSVSVFGQTTRLKPKPSTTETRKSAVRGDHGPDKDIATPERENATKRAEGWKGEDTSRMDRQEL
jgi:hypothetical protein